ncbi:MAG: hypothetical protein SV377_08350 [Halobacteria archaeon]|nr:hypothetical protein [Halobacteria archaeon]
MTDDDEIKEEILRVLIETFLEENGKVVLPSQDVVDGVTESLDVSEKDIYYNIHRLNNSNFIDFKPGKGDGSLELKVLGIDKYGDMSGDVVIPDDHIEKILGLLYDEARENPQDPSVTRDDLLQGTGLSEGELDRTVWYLKEKGQVKMTDVDKPEWRTVEIDRAGRQLYEGRYVTDG